MKRFWKEVSVDPDNGIALDGRPVRTPGRVPLLLPTPQLAEAVAQEWRDVGETIDPRAMPLTGLANAAIDRVGADPALFAANLARYAENDLLCYRANGPEPLVERQAAQWDPLLAWARSRYDIHFVTVTGVIHSPQSPVSISRLGEAVASLDPFHLAGISPLVTIGGSLIVALAMLENAIDPDTAWAAVNLDEDWQAELWGEDELATHTREARRAEWNASARFLSLLQ